MVAQGNFRIKNDGDAIAFALRLTSCMSQASSRRSSAIRRQIVSAGSSGVTVSLRSSSGRYLIQPAEQLFLSIQVYVIRRTIYLPRSATYQIVPLAPPESWIQSGR